MRPDVFHYSDRQFAGTRTDVGNRRPGRKFKYPGEMVGLALDAARNPRGKDDGDRQDRRYDAISGSSIGQKLPAPIQNLNPDVSMVQPAEDWYRYEAAELLGPPKIWSILVQ